MSLDEIDRSAPDVTGKPGAETQLEAEMPSRGRPGGRAVRSRRPLRLVAALVVAAAVLAGGISWWLDARRWETTDDAFIDAHMVMIAPQVAGRVAQVLVGDNQRVAAGQLLVRIDPAYFQAQLDQATANREAAAGSLAQAEAQHTADLADAQQDRAGVVAAEATAANAAHQLDRTRSLVQREFASRQQLDNDFANARSTSANLVGAQQKLAAAEAQLEVVRSQIATAKANLRSAAAQQQEARLNLGYTRVVASEAGRIANKNVATGDYLQVGQNLMALVPLKVWVTANFKETQLDRMRIGQPVDISIDSYPDKVFRGHLDSFEAGSGAAFDLLPPENATGNYVKVVQRVPVKIVFDTPPDPHFPLGPGMSVVPSVKVR
jgi:membrane fusion protein, multidrug efflux system